MTTRWIKASLILGTLAIQPAHAQSPAPAPASPAPTGATPAKPDAPADPNVSYPLANGGTYQGPLTGQLDPTARFYEGYSRT